jgi:rRNA-processing protein FCF1
MPKILLIDTSVLFAVFEKEVPIDLSSIIDLVHPRRIAVLSQCLKEIERKMKCGSIRERSVARSVISTMEELGIDEIEVEGPDTCDEAIISYCKGRRDVVVATLDNELKNRLLKDGVSVIYLRAGKKPVLEGPQI